MKEKKVTKQKFFVEDWLSDPDLKDWVWKDKNNKANARCFVCNKTLALSTAGRSALTDHANGRKHSEAVKKIQNFFTSAKKSTDSIASSSSAQEGKQKTLDLHVHCWCCESRNYLDFEVYLQRILKQIMWTVELFSQSNVSW